MCDVDSLSKIAKYLKVNTGRLGYNNEKVNNNLEKHFEKEKLRNALKFNPFFKFE